MSTLALAPSTTVQIPTDVLAKAVKSLLVAVNVRSLPQMQGVLLSTDGSHLTMRVFDYEMSITRRIPNTGHLALTLVNAKSLSQTLARFDAKAPVTLGVDAGKLVLTQGSKIAKLGTMDIEDYAALPQPQANREVLFAIAGADLLALAKGLNTFRGRDDMLPVLTGIQLNFAPDEDLVGYSTDRFRAGRYTTQAVTLAAGSVLLPSLLDVATLTQEAGVVYVSRQDGTLFFESVDVTVTQREMDGSFPRMSALFPEVTDERATFDGDTLVKAVQFVQPSLARNERLAFALANDTLTVSGGAEDDHSEDSLTALSHLDVETGYNPAYLIDAVKAFGRKAQVTVQVTSPTKPGLFTSADLPALEVLLMPLRAVA